MHILLRKLTRLHDLSDEEQAALLAALGPPRDITRGTDIVADGSTPKLTTVILNGTACRYKVMPGGRRHILTFQYPGDMTDLYSYVMKRLDHAVGALSDATICQIPHEKIKSLSETYPNLQYAFWRRTGEAVALRSYAERPCRRSGPFARAYQQNPCNPKGTKAHRPHRH
jgi:CRP-like cAMP-binding protein